MSFRSVFLAIVIAFALISRRFLSTARGQRLKPSSPARNWCAPAASAPNVTRRTQYSVVHEYELSMHARKGVNCLDCHQPAAGQEKKDHHGFVISTKLTAGNCRCLP